MSQTNESSVLAKFATPLIILATIIWGSSFVVMKSSVDVLPTFWPFDSVLPLLCWRWSLSNDGR